MKPVRVMKVGGLTPAAEAKIQLEAAAEHLHLKAAQAANDAVYYSRQSARLDQLTKLLTDEQMVTARDTLIEQGLLEVDGENVEVFFLTADGGDA